MVLLDLNCYILDSRVCNGIILPFGIVSLNQEGRGRGDTYTIVSAICGRINIKMGDLPAITAQRLPVRQYPDSLLLFSSSPETFCFALRYISMATLASRCPTLQLTYPECGRWLPLPCKHQWPMLNEYMQTVTEDGKFGCPLIKIYLLV
jgi:hypothetical protein